MGDGEGFVDRVGGSVDKYELRGSATQLGFRKREEETYALKGI